MSACWRLMRWMSRPVAVATQPEVTQRLLAVEHALARGELQLRALVVHRLRQRDLDAAEGVHDGLAPENSSSIMWSTRTFVSDSTVFTEQASPPCRTPS